MPKNAAHRRPSRPQRGAQRPRARPRQEKPKSVAEAANDLHARLRQTVWREAGDATPLEACLAALILSLDRKADVAKVIEAIPFRDGPLALPDIANIMINLGQKSRSGRIAVDEIDHRLAPVLFVPIVKGRPQPDDAFVVLRVDEPADGPKTFKIFSGRSTKLETIEAGTVEATRLGDAYFFQAANPEEEATAPAMRRQTGRTWFEATVFRFDKAFWRLAIVSFTLSLVSLGVPLFIMLTYDRVIGPRATGPLDYLALGVALAIGMEWILRAVRSHILAWLAARMDFVIGTAVFERLVMLPPAFVERASPAAQIARLRTFESVRDFFSGPVFMSVMDLPSVLVALAALAWFAGPLAFAPMIVAGAYIALFFFVKLKVKVAIRQAAKATSQTQQFTIETFEKLDTIRATGLTDVWLRKYKDLSGRENLLQMRLFWWGSVGEAIGHALTLAAAAMTLALGVGLIWRGEISAGVLIAAMVLTWRVLTPFQSLCSMIPRYEQLRNAILQINDLMDVETEADSDKESARLAEIKGRITFLNAGVRYSREAGPVFLGLNVDIAPGEVIVVSGSNGSGKSSLLKLVQGLYPPIAGAIRIDGFDIRQLMQRELRRKIGYVPQTSDLLAGSVADNLRFVVPLATDAEIWAVLEEVGADAEVKALPDGIDTRADGPNAKLFSATLKFRLALARALLQDSSILLIDEQPNAILNAGGANALKEALQRSRGRRTVVFVSHRVDLMRFADRAIRLRHGRPPLAGPVDLVLEEAA